MEVMDLWLCSLVFLLLAIYYCYITILILRNNRKSTVVREMLYESNEGLLKRSVVEILWYILLIVIFIANVKVGIRNKLCKPEDIVFIFIKISGCIAMIVYTFYTIMHLIYPLIITEKFFIIKGSIHKNRAIKYFMEEDTLVLVKQKRNGEQTKLLCIHINDSQTIIEIQKYAEQTENNLDHDNDN